MDDSPFSQIKTFNVSEFLCNIYYHIQQKPWKGFKYSYINFTKQLNDWGKVVLTILKYKFDDASRLQSKTSTCSIRAGCSSHLWKLIASVYSSSSFFYTSMIKILFVRTLILFCYCRDTNYAQQHILTSNTDPWYFPSLTTWSQALISQRVNLKLSILLTTKNEVHQLINDHAPLLTNFEVEKKDQLLKFLF